MVERQEFKINPISRYHEEMQQRWNESCAGVDEVLEAYAKRRHGDVQPDKDKPALNKILYWRNRKGDEHTISMSLLEEDGKTALRVWGAVWNDTGYRYIGRSRPAIEETLEAPVEVALFEKTVKDLGRRLAARSGAITRAQNSRRGFNF